MIEMKIKRVMQEIISPSKKKMDQIELYSELKPNWREKGDMLSSKLLRVVEA